MRQSAEGQTLQAGQPALPAMVWRFTNLFITPLTMLLARLRAQLIAGLPASPALTIDG